MPLEFESTQPSDLHKITEALIAGFAAPPDADFLDPELLRWKYFEPGPEWQGSRSYILRKDNVIKAHCGVWPMNLEVSHQRVTCNCYVDWVGDRDTPGAGVLVKKKLMSMADTGVVVGGTADTRAVVPRIGFRQVGEVVTFVRVVRPWKQHRNRPKERPFKAVARLARNVSWSLSPGTAETAGWRMEPLERFEAWVEVGDQTGFASPYRPAEYLNYWLRLPVAKVLPFAILHHEERRGYFLLVNIQGQTRLADIRLFSKDPNHWRVAYGLATREAEANPATYEIVAIASTPLAISSLLANGYRRRGAEPLFLYDPKRKLDNAAIFLNLIDGDGAYLYDPKHPFNT